MALTLYDISIPPFIRALRNLSSNLEKGRSFADDKSLAHAELLEGRLAPDMLTLVGQVQRATDTAKFTAVRVAQMENRVMPDEEKTFDDLQARIANTLDFLGKVPEDAMDNREDALVQLPSRNGAIDFTGTSYLLGFALPNFYFHVTTAYAILRHKGVPIGKMDFIGRP